MKNVDKIILRKNDSKDVFSVQARSRLMSKIKSRGTRFETDFVSEFKKNIRLKFELNASDIKGKPDIVFRKRKVCIFLDSDFWHGWQYPRWKYSLKNDFWREKIEKNRLRDRRTTAFFKKNGWTVIRIWEHEIEKNIYSVIGEIKKILQ